LNCLKTYKAEVENQLEKKIKHFRSKPHKVVEERHLAPLEFIHSDICEMNGVLTKGGQRNFMTMMDDASRYCYTYLLKMKDQALN
jgi:hypothetical protein